MRSSNRSRDGRRVEGGGGWETESDAVEEESVELQQELESELELTVTESGAPEAS